MRTRSFARASGASARLARSRSSRRSRSSLAGPRGARRRHDARRRCAWSGLVGEPRADGRARTALARRPRPPVARRPRRRGGRRRDDRQERRWTRQALAPRSCSSRAWRSRARRCEPDFQYARVLNGFSAPLDPRAIALLERATEVEGVYPVRAAYPGDGLVARALAARRSAPAPARGRRRRAARLRRPRRDDRAARHGRRPRAAVPARPRSCAGIDVVGGERERAGRGEAGRRPAELERHGTELAGIIVGAGGPSGLAGVATGASVLPIRVAGWQRDARGELGRVRAHRPARRRARARRRPERRRRRPRRRPRSRSSASPSRTPPSPTAPPPAPRRAR